jgi:predicted peptidase
MINRREFCLSFSAALPLPKRLVIARRASVFLAKLHQNSRGETMPYRLFVPQGYNKRKKYPLVLWLHGGAGRGNDNLKQISGGNTIGSHVWTKPHNQTKHSCFVVAPQGPDNELWATLDSAKLPSRCDLF